MTTTTLLAQASLADVPDTFWKNFCLVLIVLILVAAALVGMWAALRKPEPVKLDDQPPIEVRKSPKRFNYELSEQRYNDHERRLADLEEWRGGLIEKMERDKNEVIKAGEDRASRIHTHIENERRDLDRKIEALPGNIIATLKNTGAI